MAKGVKLSWSDWHLISECMAGGNRPWPMRAVELDWQWWLERVAAGERKRPPGRQLLARRWSMREHRVRLFLATRLAKEVQP